MHCSPEELVLVSCIAEFCSDAVNYLRADYYSENFDYLYNKAIRNAQKNSADIMKVLCHYRDKLVAENITEALLQKVFAKKFFMKLVKEDVKKKDDYYGANKKNMRCKKRKQQKKAKRTRKKCIHHLLEELDKVSSSVSMAYGSFRMREAHDYALWLYKKEQDEEEMYKRFYRTATPINLWKDPWWPG